MRIRGFIIFFVGICVLAVIMRGTANWLEMQPTPADKKFEVVDTYSYEDRTCSVIRYTNPSTTWVYFLDCKEVKK
jgi:hypothetical protein